MPMTGADLSSLQTIRTVAATTGDLAVTTASATARATETAKAEVDDVVAAMTTQFNDTLDHLESMANQADQQLATAGWQGAARDTAVQASADFRAGITRLGTDSRTALTEFSTALDTEVASLNEDITGQFTTLMTAAQQAFESFAAAVASYGADLQAADSSITYR